MHITKYQEDVQNLIYKIQQFRGADPQVVLESCNRLEEYGNNLEDEGLIGFAQFSRGETYYLLNDVMKPYVYPHNYILIFFSFMIAYHFEMLLGIYFSSLEIPFSFLFFF